MPRSRPWPRFPGSDPVFLDLTPLLATPLLRCSWSWGIAVPFSTALKLPKRPFCGSTAYTGAVAVTRFRAFAAFVLAAWLSPAWVVIPAAAAAAPSPPNIVLVYADDLGFGDVGMNGSATVRTPNIDALAADGLRFTNAHAPAATCTPSRYSLLTGEYA